MAVRFPLRADLVVVAVGERRPGNGRPHAARPARSRNWNSYSLPGSNDRFSVRQRLLSSPVPVTSSTSRGANPAAAAPFQLPALGDSLPSLRSGFGAEGAGESPAASSTAPGRTKRDNEGKQAAHGMGSRGTARRTPAADPADRRIVLRPCRRGNHRIIASHFAGQAQILVGIASPQATAIVRGPIHPLWRWGTCYNGGHCGLRKSGGCGMTFSPTLAGGVESFSTVIWIGTGEVGDARDGEVRSSCCACRRRGTKMRRSCWACTGSGCGG